jgi:hypothetical protein
LKVSNYYFYKFESQDDFVRNYDRIFTGDVRSEILKRQPRSLGHGSFLLEWTKGGSSYTLIFVDDGGGYKFCGMALGPE